MNETALYREYQMGDPSSTVVALQAGR